jgi:hypothetical protein
MKKLIKRLEDMMIAITFAEAGEFEKALEVMKEPPAQGAPETAPLEGEYETLGS